MAEAPKEPDNKREDSQPPKQDAPRHRPEPTFREVVVWQGQSARKSDLAYADVIGTDGERRAASELESVLRSRSDTEHTVTAPDGAPFVIECEWSGQSSLLVRFFSVDNRTPLGVVGLAIGIDSHTDEIVIRDAGREYDFPLPSDAKDPKRPMSLVVYSGHAAVESDDQAAFGSIKRVVAATFFRQQGLV